MNFEIDEDFYDEGIGSLEAKSALERVRADGAQVEVDLESNTSLRRYTASRRAAAKEALVALTAIGPSDALGIAQLQHVVAEYLNVMGWVRQEIEASVHADNELQRGHRGDDD